MDQGGVSGEAGPRGRGARQAGRSHGCGNGGELSPIVTGLVYCSVIDGCQEVHELRRASEWTAALTQWCDAQPGLVPLRALPRASRGAHAAARRLGAALEEARLAGERLALRSNDAAVGQARTGRGDSSPPGPPGGGRAGLSRCQPPWHEPQPGLALLLLAQGRTDPAAAAIEQVVAATTEESSVRGFCRPTSRSWWPPAIASGRACVRRARGGGGELRQRDAARACRVARGAVALVDGDGRGALVALRRAGSSGRSWRRRTRARVPAS